MSRKMLHSKRKILLMLKFGFRCYICGLDFLQSPAHFHLASLDHFTPRAKGGSSDHDNLIPCCSLCNFLKGQRSYPTVEIAKQAILQRREKYLDSFHKFLFNAPYFPHDRLSGNEAMTVIEKLWNPLTLRDEAREFESAN